MKLIAHIKKDATGKWILHDLKEHLQGVADLAEKFATPMGLAKPARLLGLLHDIGKTSDAFQQRIAGKSGYDPSAHISHHVDHSTAGAKHLSANYSQLGILLAYCIAGHHGGLPNGFDESESCLTKRLKKIIESYSIENLQLDLTHIEPSDFIPHKHKDNSPPQIPLLIRMLYSALVDADFLDTEKFMAPEESQVRLAAYNSLVQLREKLNKHVSEFSIAGKINRYRNEILASCREASDTAPGIFSLTVPTGGGKTISSMAFALNHAIRNDQRRVIYVIPYTSIISQNADVFRRIFGDENILEHHSNLDPEKETTLNRLSAQNWDTPIVVTTNVQFFESFYSNRSSSCRKLHNVADSIIIFDEAQMFPAEYLKPSISIIRELVRSYGCSAVLCTATQPTLSEKSLLKGDALENVTEIVPDPEKLYNAFKRVKVSVIAEPQPHKSIAEKMAECNQILTIVNTRKEARQIMESLLELTSDSESCYHLSTMMCPEHRSETLKIIHKRIDANLACRVVSTQLIEAGVDVDFPVVYRAVAGIDSIAQAAGRCNRNGMADFGQVFVFIGESEPPVGHLRQAAQSGVRALDSFADDPLSLESVSSYFRDFYWKQNNAHKLDKKEIMQMIRCNTDHIPFKDMAKAFSIIEEETRSIIVPHGEEGVTFIENLREWATKLGFVSPGNMFLPRESLQRAQRFSVQVRKKPFEELVAAGVLEDLFDDGQYWILLNRDIYNGKVGLTTDRPAYMESESTII
jgi:CRISPR-associated endonuclease/helicase Cas3